MFGVVVGICVPRNSPQDAMGHWINSAIMRAEGIKPHLSSSPNHEPEPCICDIHMWKSHIEIWERESRILCGARNTHRTYYVNGPTDDLQMMLWGCVYSASSLSGLCVSKEWFCEDVPVGLSGSTFVRIFVRSRRPGPMRTSLKVVIALLYELLHIHTHTLTIAHIF